MLLERHGALKRGVRSLGVSLGFFMLFLISCCLFYLKFQLHDQFVSLGGINLITFFQLSPQIILRMKIISRHTQLPRFSCSSIFSHGIIDHVESFGLFGMKFYGPN